MKANWALAAAIAWVGVQGGCDTPRLCPPGVCREFQPDPMQVPVGYHVKEDTLTLWLMPRPCEGTDCLPQELSIRNVKAPEGCHVTYQPSLWVKGRGQLIIYIDGARVLQGGKTASLDIYQGAQRRQTVTLAMTPPPLPTLLLNGEPVMTRAVAPFPAGLRTGSCFHELPLAGLTKEQVLARMGKPSNVRRKDFRPPSVPVEPSEEMDEQWLYTARPMALTAVSFRAGRVSWAFDEWSDY